MRDKPKFAVLGAGNGGLATSADLAVRGFDVSLWEHPDFKANITPIQEKGGIILEAVSYTHLDVYKRQDQYCPEGEMSCGRLQGKVKDEDKAEA